MRICALIEIDFFFLCRDLKVLEVIHNLWSIIDGIIVKNFLECILVLLREDGDDQPLILQAKLILKETLMIVHVMQQSSLAFLGCGSVRISFCRCLRRK